MATMLGPTNPLMSNGGRGQSEGYAGGRGAGGDDKEELRYDELESLGLVLEPDDAQILLASATD